MYVKCLELTVLKFLIVDRFQARSQLNTVGGRIHRNDGPGNNLKVNVNNIPGSTLSWHNVVFWLVKLNSGHQLLFNV